MKVNDRGAKSVSTSPTAVRAKELEKSLKNANLNDIGGKNNVSGSTKVQVSPEAQAFQKAKAIASSSTVDEAKVARLQKLIDEGKYKVDSQAIADRLVDEQLATGE
jgi:flagellar biosynthesis anti-sigma factor FlgM